MGGDRKVFFPKLQKDSYGMQEADGLISNLMMDAQRKLLEKVEAHLEDSVKHVQNQEARAELKETMRRALWNSMRVRVDIVDNRELVMRLVPKENNEA